MAASAFTDAVCDLHITVADHAPTPAAESCRFLEKIPAELRNDIYQLVFTPDHDTEGKVDLFKAAPPQKSILSTCRQIYDEAREYYIESYRKNWQDAEFEIVCEIPPDPYNPESDEDDEEFIYQEEDDLTAVEKVEMVEFRAEDVNQIRSICVCREFAYADGSSGFSRFEFQDGVWIGKSRMGKETLNFIANHDPSDPIDVYDEDFNRFPFHHRQSPDRPLPFHQQLACLVWYLSVWGGECYWIDPLALPVWGRSDCKK